MKRSGITLGVAAIALCGAGFATGAPAGAPDVCQLLPAQLVATEMDATLLATRNFPDAQHGRARCVYQLAFPRTKGDDDGPQTAIVVWFQPADEYDELAAEHEGPKDVVTGVGDAAFAFLDPGDKRHKIFAVKRGRGMIEVSAERPDHLQALARLALEHLPAK